MGAPSSQSWGLSFTGTHGLGVGLFPPSLPCLPTRFLEASLGLEGSQADPSGTRVCPGPDPGCSTHLLQPFVLILKLWQGQTSRQTRAQLVQKRISPPPGYPLGRQSNLLHPLLTAHRLWGGGPPHPHTGGVLPENWAPLRQAPILGCTG